MSIQFRNRIKPAIDYSDILNSYGVCCGATGSTGNVKHFIECFNEGGYFVPVKNGEQQVECPNMDQERGCCCSCSFVDVNERQLEVSQYTTGLKSGTTRCECARSRGRWSPYIDGATGCSNSVENFQNYCIEPGPIDVREPKSCCHLKFDDITGWPTGIECIDVCSSQDCAILGTDIYPSTFGTTRCIIGNQNPVVCNTIANFPLIPPLTSL